MFFFRKKEIKLDEIFNLDQIKRYLGWGFVFSICDECGGLFRTAKMKRIEVIRRSRRHPSMRPWVDYEYFCTHCQKGKENGQ